MKVHGSDTVVEYMTYIT